MHKFKRIIGIALMSTILISSSVAGIAKDTSAQNPYVQQYLLEKSENETSRAKAGLSGDEGVADPEAEEKIIIATLEDYYSDDLKVADVLSKYYKDYDLRTKTISIKKEDKISIMQAIKKMYSSVEDMEEKEILKGYFLRYAKNSKDSTATAFLNELYPNTKRKSSDINKSENQKKGISTIQTQTLSSSAAYTTLTSYNGLAAGDWAYSNYNKYSTDYPSFHDNGDFGSDCANFVSQAMHVGGGMAMTGNWYCYKKNSKYLNPRSAEELNYSWSLADPSPWISAKEFRNFWATKSITDLYSHDEYINLHTVIYSKPIYKGDVIVLHKGVFGWATVPTHVMIISAYDTANSDFKLAAHSVERKDLPLLTAIQDYAAVEILQIS